MFSATPSITARTIIARSVRKDMFTKAARRFLSSIGLRSPASHGVKISPSHPAGAVAAKAVRGVVCRLFEDRCGAVRPMPLPPPSNPSEGR